MSDPILSELRRTLARPYSAAHLSPTTAAAYVRTLAALSLLVPITAPVHGVATHPEDDLILATAVSARANYLVTGDQPLRRVGSIHDIPIVSPIDFLHTIMKDDKPGLSSTVLTWVLSILSHKGPSMRYPDDSLQEILVYCNKMPSNGRLGEGPFPLALQRQVLLFPL